jgi:helix-turn-helix protein/uncharacterized protein DUF4115
LIHMQDDYKDIGNLLKQERLRRNKTLEIISEESKVSETYLDAIENGDISVFPSRVYYNMFARSYARDLGFDTDELFGVETQPVLPVEGAEDSSTSGTAGGQKEKVKNSDSSVLKIGLWLVAIVAVIFIIIIIASSLGDDAAEDQDGEYNPAVTEEVEQEPDITANDNRDSAQTVGINNQPEVNLSPALPPIKMNILVFDSCWIYVKADGDTILNRNLIGGNSRSLSADSNFIISIGNPIGVELRINDTLLGPLSRRNRPVMEFEINRENYGDYFFQPEDSVVVTP